MDSSAVVDVRNARLLDLATYGVLVIMGALGLSGLTGSAERTVAIGLCSAFALSNAVGPRLARTPRQLTMFFALQTSLITALLALRSSTFDTFHVPVLHARRAGRGRVPGATSRGLDRALLAAVRPDGDLDSGRGSTLWSAL